MKILILSCFLLYLTGSAHSQVNEDTSYTLDEENNLYAIRVVWEDTESNINFYGFCLGGTHLNKSASYSGLTFNAGMGNKIMGSGKALTAININGINFSLLMTMTYGTINGFSFGGVLGNESGRLNGIAVGGVFAGSDSLNGITIGGLISGNNYANGIVLGGIFTVSKSANGIQFGGIVNGYSRFNGVGLAPVNAYVDSDSLNGTGKFINGLIVGGLNAVDVNGVSIGIVNKGDFWLQIGLLNMGNGAVQIGLVNLDGNYGMRIPLVSVKF